MKISDLKGLKLAKFILMIVSLIFISITVLFAITVIFGVSYGVWFLPLIVSLLAIGFGCFFAINSLNMVQRSRVMGWLSLSLIAVAVLFTLIYSIFSIENEVYVQFLISFIILSVLFNLLVSIALELGKKYLIFQICTYSLLAILDFVATLVIFDTIPKGNGMGTKIFISFALVAFVLIVTLKILAKVGNKESKKVLDNKTITISIEEYEDLKRKALKYDEIENLRNKN